MLDAEGATTAEPDLRRTISAVELAELVGDAAVARLAAALGHGSYDTIQLRRVEQIAGRFRLNSIAQQPTNM